MLSASCSPGLEQAFSLKQSWAASQLQQGTILQPAATSNLQRHLWCCSFSSELGDVSLTTGLVRGPCPFPDFPYLLSS